MSPRWFYSHAGKTHGPLSAEEMSARAAQGKIARTDLVWQQGSRPEDGVQAEAVLEIKESEAPELPDWLEDVRACQKIGPEPPPQPNTELPEWIEDLRIWIGLDYFEQTVPWDYSLGPPPASAGISKSVEKWFPGEPTPPVAEPIPTAKPIPAPHVVPPSEAKKPVAPPEPKKAIPIAKPVVPAKTKEAIPVAKPFRPPEPKAPPAAPPPPAAAPPSAPKKTRTSPAAAPPADLLAEQAVQQTGFDPRTGRIVDAARFKEWKKEQSGAVGQVGAGQVGAKPQAAVSNAGLMEIFRKARTAVENWLDEEANRPLVLALDLGAIRKHHDIQAVLAKYAGYGPAFRDKLLRHLEFMAENRCKYYTARPNG